MPFSAGDPFLESLFLFTLVPFGVSEWTGILDLDDGIEDGDLIFGTVEGDVGGSFGWISLRGLAG